MLMLIPTACICVGGYYLYGALVAGSFVAALAEIPGNIVQSVASGVVFTVAGITIDKLNIKKKILDKDSI